MKIDVTGDGVLVLKEVYNSIILETEGGQRLAVCMRDFGFDIGIYKANDIVWYHGVDGKIEKLGITQMEIIDCANGVQGNYCIRREMPGGFVSYWTFEGWKAFGYVFVDKQMAKLVLDGLLLGDCE